MIETSNLYSGGTVNKTQQNGGQALAVKQVVAHHERSPPWLLATQPHKQSAHRLMAC